VFALLKGRFRRLHFIEWKNVKTVDDIVIACCVLHNISISEGDIALDFMEPRCDRISSISKNMILTTNLWTINPKLRVPQHLKTSRPTNKTASEPHIMWTDSLEYHTVITSQPLPAALYLSWNGCTTPLLRRKADNYIRKNSFGRPSTSWTSWTSRKCQTFIGLLWHIWFVSSHNQPTL
jgi:hypothetical protein